MSTVGCSSKPKIITMCGSMRFADEMLRIQSFLTLEGCIVLVPGFFSRAECARIDEQKKQLDLLHKRKIEMSDEIFVVNPGGYLGESTFSDIMYALTLGVKVSSSEDLDDYVCFSDHDAYMAIGEHLAVEQLDAALHSNAYCPEEYPHFVYKGTPILDPWVNVEANQGKYPWPTHDEGRWCVNPKTAYGKKNLARFIDGLIQQREPAWFKNHLLRNRAEALSYQNRAAIETSKLCGCFSCGAIFKPEELIDTGNPHWNVDAKGNVDAVLGGWVDEGKTAVCPYCHVDQVIGDSMGFEITKDLLNTIASSEFVYGAKPL